VKFPIYEINTTFLIEFIDVINQTLLLNFVSTSQNHLIHSLAVCFIRILLNPPPISVNSFRARGQPYYFLEPPSVALMCHNKM
jgi:hypothetical protein